MLKIRPHTSSSAAKWYYTGNRHEYYSEDQESRGVWGGKGAVRLGLVGEVSSEAFGALCDNLHPTLGRRLTARMKDNRRIGYDLTFSPPKSVSIVHALTRDDRIVEAVQEAAQAAMQFVERDAKTRVRAGGQDFDRLTGELTWAAFTHRTSRPVSGVPDPQLHVHCFTFNATYDDTERRWKAAQLGDIVKMGPYYQAIFHSELAANLERLGYELVRSDKSFELANISPEIIKKFSKRHQQIDDRAAEHGVTSKKTRAVLAVMTREAKRHDLTPEHLHDHWISRLTPTERAFMAEYRPYTPALEPASPDIDVENKALLYAAERCFERDSVVDVRVFLEAALRFGMGRVDPERLRERIASDAAFMRREHKGRFVITTPAIVAEERFMVAWVQNGHETRTPLVTKPELPQHLSADQRMAALSVLHSRDRITAIIGKAGTGKTSLMRATIDAIRPTNTPVVVCAPNSDTAHETLLKAGFPDASTVRAFIDYPQIHERAKNGVIWIDEAGLVAVKDMVAVMFLADKLSARIVLCGDTRQHRPVERGDALRILESHTDLETVSLNNNLRQSGKYREIVDELSDGKYLSAYQKLDEIGALVEISGPERFEYIAREYVRLRDGPDSVHIVSPTHGEGFKVTEAVRAALKVNGELSDERSFLHLRRIDLHNADKQCPMVFQPGWVIEFIKSDGGYQAGERLTVSHIDGGRLFVRHSDGAIRPLDVERWSKRFQVYEPGEIDIAIGDRIRVSKNGLDPARRKLINSTLHTVAGFTSTGDIQLTSGRIVPQNFGHIAHGYVTTSYVAQSKTVQYVIIAEGTESFAAANRQQGYVSLSRGRAAPLMVTDDKEGLFEALSADSRRVAALDVERQTQLTLEPKPFPPARELLGERTNPVPVPHPVRGLRFAPAQVI